MSGLTKIGRRGLAILGLIAAMLGAPGGPVGAGEVPDAPILRLEAGVHGALVGRMARDASGRLLATVSYDKTLRLWSAESGELKRILRVPLGPGGEGQLYGVALSPDGTQVAVGGWTGSWGPGYSLYLFDTASGRPLRPIAGPAERRPMRRLRPLNRAHRRARSPAAPPGAAVCVSGARPRRFLIRSRIQPRE